MQSFLDGEKKRVLGLLGSRAPGLGLCKGGLNI